MLPSTGKRTGEQGDVGVVGNLAGEDVREQDRKSGKD